MKNIRILQIIAQKPYATGSGVYAKELVRVMAEKGYKQGIIYGEDQTPSLWHEVDIEEFKIEFGSSELPFYIVGMSDVMPYKSTIYSKLDKIQTDKLTEVFSNIIKKADMEFQPDLVICHHLYYITALTVKLLPHRNVVAICHGTCLRQMNNHNWKKSFISENIKNVNHIFALHQVQKKQVMETFKVEDSRVEVIGIGYNDKIFYNENTNQKDRLVYAGKLSPSKGIEYLIDALNYVNEGVQLDIVGDGSDEKFVNKLKHKAKIINSREKHKINFLGRLEQVELGRVFRTGEIFVLPSFYEGLPLIIIEAIACGMKVVFSEIEGPSRWLKDNINEDVIEFIKLIGILEDYGEASFDEEKFAKDIAQSINKSRNKKYIFKKNMLKNLGWGSLCDKIVKSI